MKDKINVAELLKDCPSGMELDCTMYDDVFFYEITDDLIFPIRIKRIDGAPITLTKYGGYADCPTSKCVIFPKGKTTWEGFRRPFKNGDILTTSMGSIFIFSHLELDKIDDRNICKAYVGIQNTRPISFFHTEQSDFFGPYESMCKLATEEEKQKLFQAIKDNGYKWNEETKTLEKLDKPKFKNGDVITCTNSACSFVAIFKERNTDITFRRYVSLTLDPVQQFWTNEGWCDFSNPRLATEEEKQKLFQAIKDNGYKWNPETKTLEKLPKFKVGDRIILKDNQHNIPSIKIKAVTKSQYILENEGFLYIDSTDEKYVLEDRFDITTLKPFDKVLVKTNVHDPLWSIDFFGMYSLKFSNFTPFMVTSGKFFQQCIPYEGNEHLLGKTDDCDEFYRIWEKTGN